jgi:glutamate synthase domain-containing protein 1
MEEKKEKSEGKEKEEKNKRKNTASGNGEDKELKDKIIEEDVDEMKEEEEKIKEERLIKELQEEIDKLTTRDILTQMMMSLSSLAYKKMGIPAGVNDKYKDRQQAKMAIDGFDSLFKVITDEISESERENLQSSLSNLQMNFVKVFS